MVIETMTEAEELSSARARLRDAVAGIERAVRPRHGRETSSALKWWRALVAVSWSVIDHFENGGRRYLVAVTLAPGPEILSQRERQVLAAAVTGRTNKHIAYELGLSDSTVRVLMARSAKKLGVKKRADLIALYLSYAPRPEPLELATPRSGITPRSPRGGRAR